MSYIPISDQDKKEMLARIGVESVEDLFCCIPESIRLKGLLNLPGPLSEPEILEYFEERGRKNSFDRYLSFLGGEPMTISFRRWSITETRGEFVSPYTPYQPEVSQGTLQVIFEFQTLICQLTGLDIANASLYDGATGAAEAVLMANRVKNKKRLLVASNVHPEYRQVIYTYTRNLGLEVVEIPYDRLGRVDQKGLESALNSHTSVLLCQSPNYFGVVEDLKSLSEPDPPP